MLTTSLPVMANRTTDMRFTSITVNEHFADAGFSGQQMQFFPSLADNLTGPAYGWNGGVASEVGPFLTQDNVQYHINRVSLQSEFDLLYNRSQI